MEINEKDYLSHYGILRRSGRYPWGSGGATDLENHTGFLDYLADLRGQGLSEKQIAEALSTPEHKVSTTLLRDYNSIAKNEVRAARIAQAERMRAKGMSYIAIGERMGMPESTVRSLLKQDTKDRSEILGSTVDMLKEQVANKKYIDVGKGTEYQLNISETKKNQALTKLKEEGYQVFYVKETQLGTGKDTSIKVLVGPGTTYSELSNNRDQIQQIHNRSEDGGRTYLGMEVAPLSISPRRVKINYAEDGGKDADGVIYVRPGVKDLSLGGSRYAQVRIAVGGTHYLKGMAMYKDDLPEGVDLVFNTNKSVLDLPKKTDAFKPMKTHEDGTIDMDNPFGATISRQITRKKRDGTVVAESAMNIVNEEGDWAKWSKSLSSQVLSKQPVTLAKTQLNMAHEQRLQEYARISALTNPTVKKKLLETFGDEADSAAVHLKAAALGARQSSHVILPINSLKDSEVYAPGYKDGETVVLIRYPHAGTFEIPQLKVNNRHREARAVIGPNAKDAIGINSTVAERLSGADFDGDSVLVIPNNDGRVRVTAALKGLQDFDPRSEYKAYEGMPRMTSKQKAAEMGDVSNLITDMTIKQASPSEITRAVKHSMVVIDAEKHNLNWRLSKEQNGIRELKAKYQGGPNAGASTLISRAGGEKRIPKRIPRRAREGGPIDPATGKRVFTETGETYVNRKGKEVKSTVTVKRLAVEDDAFTLVSEPTGTPIERLYAEHSNRLKALGNRARKESLETPKLRYSPSARKVYSHEVESLNAQLALAKRNAPYERQAQVLGNATYKRKLSANPDMDATTRKKVKAQALNEARNRVGARKHQIIVSDREWEAIQAGALHDSRVQEILTHADLDRIKELATPKPVVTMTSARTARAQAMLDSGHYTRSEVASALGVSLSTLDAVTDVKGVE